jgi:hypothetical protein
MPRLALAFALLFAPPLLAAPVPKALKKQPAVPPVLGTTWNGSSGGSSPYDYTFHPDGTFSTAVNGKPHSSKGTWKQDGDTLEWEFNNRYSVYTVKFQDGTFEGSASNIKGKSWAVTLKPVAK